MFTDAHAHLNDPVFGDDFELAIQRAQEAGVGVLVNAAWDLFSTERAAYLADTYSCCYFTAGYHPHQAKDATEEYLDHIAFLAQHPKCVAIGEIGLDYHYDLSPREVQKEMFRRQLRMARKIGKPVVLHLREAYADANKILLEERDCLLNGVLLHCYGGSMESARDFYNKLGCYYSFGGAVTFKNAKKGEVLRAVPRDRLLLETDCPYMTPVPHRGERNEPAWIPLIAAKVAEELGLSVEEVEKQTYDNFLTFYRISL